MNRRQTILSALAAMIATCLPRNPLPALPVLYGDGETDDYEALQAFIDGKDIIHEGRVINRDRGDTIVGKRFYLDTPVYVHSGPLPIKGSEFRAFKLGRL